MMKSTLTPKHAAVPLSPVRKVYLMLDQDIDNSRPSTTGPLSAINVSVPAASPPPPQHVHSSSPNKPFSLSGEVEAFYRQRPELRNTSSRQFSDDGNAGSHEFIDSTVHRIPTVEASISLESLDSNIQNQMRTPTLESKPPSVASGTIGSIVENSLFTPGDEHSLERYMQEIELKARQEHDASVASSNLKDSDSVSATLTDVDESRSQDAASGRASQNPAAQGSAGPSVQSGSLQDKLGSHSLSLESKPLNTLTFRFNNLGNWAADSVDPKVRVAKMKIAEDVVMREAVLIRLEDIIVRLDSAYWRYCTLRIKATEGGEAVKQHQTTELVTACRDVRSLQHEVAVLIAHARSLAVGIIENIAKVRRLFRRKFTTSAEVSIYWSDENYLLKMKHDMQFLDNTPTMRLWLGFVPSNLILPPEHGHNPSLRWKVSARRVFQAWFGRHEEYVRNSWKSGRSKVSIPPNRKFLTQEVRNNGYREEIPKRDFIAAAQLFVTKAMAAEVSGAKSLNAAGEAGLGDTTAATAADSAMHQDHHVGTQNGAVSRRHTQIGSRSQTPDSAAVADAGMAAGEGRMGRHSMFSSAAGTPSRSRSPSRTPPPANHHRLSMFSSGVHPEPAGFSPPGSAGYIGGGIAAAGIAAITTSPWHSAGGSRTPTPPRSELLFPGASAHEHTNSATEGGAPIISRRSRIPSALHNHVRILQMHQQATATAGFTTTTVSAAGGGTAVLSEENSSIGEESSGSLEGAALEATLPTHAMTSVKNTGNIAARITAAVTNVHVVGGGGIFDAVELEEWEQLREYCTHSWGPLTPEAAAATAAAERQRFQQLTFTNSSKASSNSKRGLDGAAVGAHGRSSNFSGGLHAAAAAVLATSIPLRRESLIEIRKHSMRGRSMSVGALVNAQQQQQLQAQQQQQQQVQRLSTALETAAEEEENEHESAADDDDNGISLHTPAAATAATTATAATVSGDDEQDDDFYDDNDDDESIWDREYVPTLAQGIEVAPLFWDTIDHNPLVVEAATGFEETFPTQPMVPSVPPALRQRILQCEQLLEKEFVNSLNIARSSAVSQELRETVLNSTSVEKMEKIKEISSTMVSAAAAHSATSSADAAAAADSVISSSDAAAAAPVGAMKGAELLRHRQQSSTEELTGISVDYLAHVTQLPLELIPFSESSHIIPQEEKTRSGIITGAVSTSSSSKKEGDDVFITASMRNEDDALQQEDATHDHDGMVAGASNVDPSTFISSQHAHGSYINPTDFQAFRVEQSSKVRQRIEEIVDDSRSLIEYKEGELLPSVRPDKINRREANRYDGQWHHKQAIVIQKLMRGKLSRLEVHRRKKLAKWRAVVVKLQCLMRGFISRRKKRQRDWDNRYKTFILRKQAARRFRASIALSTFFKRIVKARREVIAQEELAAGKRRTLQGTAAQKLFKAARTMQIAKSVAASSAAVASPPNSPLHRTLSAYEKRIEREEEARQNAIKLKNKQVAEKLFEEKVRKHRQKLVSDDLSKEVNDAISAALSKDVDLSQFDTSGSLLSEIDQLTPARSQMGSRQNSLEARHSLHHSGTGVDHASTVSALDANGSGQSNDAHSQQSPAPPLTDLGKSISQLSTPSVVSQYHEDEASVNIELRKIQSRQHHVELDEGKKLELLGFNEEAKRRERLKQQALNLVARVNRGKPQLDSVHHCRLIPSKTVGNDEDLDPSAATIRTKKFAVKEHVFIKNPAAHKPQSLIQSSNDVFIGPIPRRMRTPHTLNNTASMEQSQQFLDGAVAVEGSMRRLDSYSRDKMDAVQLSEQSAATTAAAGAGAGGGGGVMAAPRFDGILAREYRSPAATPAYSASSPGLAGTSPVSPLGFNTDNDQFFHSGTCYGNVTSSGSHNVRGDYGGGMQGLFGGMLGYRNVGGIGGKSVTIADLLTEEHAITGLADDNNSPAAGNNLNSSEHGATSTGHDGIATAAGFYDNNTSTSYSSNNNNNVSAADAKFRRSSTGSMQRSGSNVISMPNLRLSADSSSTKQQRGFDQKLFSSNSVSSLPQQQQQQQQQRRISASGVLAVEDTAAEVPATAAAAAGSPHSLLNYNTMGMSTKARRIALQRAKTEQERVQLRSALRKYV